MKMITAIVNKEDSSDVCKSLVKEGIMFTKTSSTGGFLRKGNTTLLIGVDDDKLESVIDIIRKHCFTRKISIPASHGHEGMPVFYHTTMTEVVEGGATVFVTNVERFEKM